MTKPIKLQLSSMYGKLGDKITYNPSNSIDKINNISREEWQLILSCMNNELYNGAFNEIFPNRKEKIEKLIEKMKNSNN